MPRSGRKPKSPAFQFYPGDFLADPKVQAMRAEEVGAYLLLLCAEWLDGPLPDDQGFLARVCRLGAAEFAQAWQALGRCFRPSEDRPGYLENPRLERERAFQAEGRQRRLDASKVAQEARLALESSTNRDTDGLESNPPLDPTPDSRSPTKKAPAAPAPAVTSKTRKEPAGPHPETVTWWMDRYLAETGSAYGFHGGKDGAAVKALLKDAGAGGLAEIKVRGERYFADPFYRKNLNLSGFAGAWNNLTRAREGARPGGSPPAKPTAAVKAEHARAAYERDVQRRWEDKHRIEREMPSPAGGTVKRLVLDRAYPGFEAAERELKAAGAA